MEITFKISRGSKKEKELSPPIPEATPAATPLLPPVANTTTQQVDLKYNYFNNFVANDFRFVRVFLQKIVQCAADNFFHRQAHFG